MLQLLIQIRHRHSPIGGEVEHSDALAEHALTTATVDQLNPLGAAVVLDALHQRFTGIQQCLALPDGLQGLVRRGRCNTCSLKNAGCQIRSITVHI